LIPFNKPFLTGRETDYIKQAVESGKISGDGMFTKKCHSFFESRFGFRKAFLTTSCTDALEMAALLINISPGDEVIMPSFTFVSTANPFVLRGATIRFIDSRSDHPGMDESLIEEVITPKTRAIVAMHYGGVACDMEKIMQIATKYGLFVIEDAAQAIDSYYTYSDGSKKALGSIGHLAAFSFHETKNIISGEGGMLVVNDPSMISRAEIIREKGTNRSSFFRGEIDKYGWVDIGSSFLPSEIIAAFLWAQLENLDDIQKKRKQIWNSYWLRLKDHEGKFSLPFIPSYASNNAHVFYLVYPDIEERTKAIEDCRTNGILTIFHYLSLHKSAYYSGKHDGRELPNSDRYTDCLLRLPLYFELTEEQLDKVVNVLLNESRE